MTEMETNTGYSAERRRNAKRDFEKGIISNAPDKFQLNDIALGALVVIAAVLSFTDFSFTAGDWKNLTALTLFLYIITMFIYHNRYEKGMSRGRDDPEYKETLQKYREKREEINQKNLGSHVPGFCTYYKKTELREYRESLLCDIEMDYDTYREKYMMMPKKEVLRLPLSADAKMVILKCNNAKTVKIYPGLILNESGEFDREKIIGKSGRQRERQDKKRQAVTRAAYVLFGSAIAFDMIFNFSLMTIAQWIIRMLPIMLAIVSGDDGGYCNITVTETNFKRDQTHVIGLFMEYAKKNILIEDTSDTNTSETSDTPETH
jgi:hypothetical protein